MAVRFEVIFITDNYTIDRGAEQLRLILESKRKCNFIWFNESRAVIHNAPKVFERESLSEVLAKNFNNRDIWYCENAICDKKGTYNIELVSNTKLMILEECLEKC